MFDSKAHVRYTLNHLWEIIANALVKGGNYLILFNFDSAEKIATTMKNASNTINDATQTTINKDNQTTLQVNQKAQEGNEEAKQLAEMFHQSFLTTLQNIQSVAEEFERADEDISNQINGSPIMDGVRDWKTYQNAKKG